MHDHCDDGRDESRPGTLISGRYRLLKRLRRGGMSEVFLAFDEQEQRHVALKVVMNNDAECIKRLQREVRILRTLSHPHILPLLGDGISGSSYYLVMPYMERGNLRERLAQGRFSPEEAGVILHQLADALTCAHRHGILHRDIKPSNILLDTEDANHIYLADFGIAKVVEEGSDITQTGFLVGTPEYMAPELAEQSESERSDIYAVGVLLYQMLTGRLPFTGTTPLAVCWKHIREQPARPSSLNPDLTDAIERVILRAMHKDPRRRFADAGALSLAYANALNGVEEAAGLQLVPSIDIPVLPSSRVMIRKVGKGFARRASAGGWRQRAGAMARRGALSVAALLLLALPVSLGIVVAHDGLHMRPAAATRPSVSINQAFVGGSLASNVVPPLITTTAPPANAARPVADQPQTDQSQPTTSPPANGGNDHGHKHKHKHGHGDD